ncbi:gp010L [Rabbit fibroma virus]|uniref:Growth factor n=1 Tax=Rabbit fibroma virus (strain Kasza) TaxID=10272 RepID=GRFA_RFVKA|nr:gp010L [Rabbit fibroma virus]P08441.1 RecName: Full=Growth factor; AltName: Full=Secreted epidermal growth factor-like; Flags: Precursor [Rabbit fibroma virus (strain Kasza)]AAA66873.1 growth factor [Rabbit fibroma virus]AAF17894.1 gp010L [Rabbit fibroma virus]
MATRNLVASLLCIMYAVHAMNDYLYIVKHVKVCNHDYENYCLNNGTCFTIALDNVSITPFCVCRINYEGSRCQFINLVTY